MDSGSITVLLFKYKDKTQLEFPITPDLTCEAVCIKTAKILKFRPLTLNLFGLRLCGKSAKEDNIWLPPSYVFESSKTYYAEFRLRFRLPSFNFLSRADANAFDYVFHQVRADLLAGFIPEDPKRLKDVKDEILGLCVTDMLRAVLEDGGKRDSVESNYKAFVPKSIYSKHSIFLKRSMKEYLNKLLTNEETKDTKFVKEQYMSQVESITPEYLAQEFVAKIFLKENEYPAIIRVNILDKEFPGISSTYVGKKNWEHLCKIEDLCFISIREDCTIEISRRNGIPINIHFTSTDRLQTFVSLLDGYYRLSEKWTFNLCKELPSPSLLKLRAAKCHGPFGDKFAYEKLVTHSNSTDGSYLLRQSSTVFDEFCLDYINTTKSSPATKTIYKKNDKYFLRDYKSDFCSIQELVSHYVKNPEKDFTIKECLPPSDYDRSPLLLCRNVGPDGSEAPLEKDDGVGSPACINARSLQVFRGKKYQYDGKFCTVNKAIWNRKKNISVEVAIKYLKKDNEDKFKELLEVAYSCVVWQSESLVTLRGIILKSPVALVFDWMPLGSLDNYLTENSLHVEINELIEAASHVAKAVWFLEDHGIVHGNIRCHNVLVAEHSESAFICKLSDPSIIEYSDNEIHWIPPELYEMTNLCKSTSSADVWALGTTLWEIFSLGTKPAKGLSLPLVGYKLKYSSGWRLPQPQNCPLEVYKILCECWAENISARKQAQSIVRDIHQILYKVMGMRRGHNYTTITPTPSESDSQENSEFNLSNDVIWTTFGSESKGDGSIHSDETVSTFINENSSTSLRSDSYKSNHTESTWLFQSDSTSPDLISNYNGSIYSFAAQGIYEFGKDQVTLGRIIGDGCYGVVYLGELRRSTGNKEVIAVKMMKEKENAPDIEVDLHAEFKILQSLCHPNIVEVKGVVYDGGLLLLMEYLPMGSLLDHFKINYTKFNLAQLVTFAKDVAEGMEYLGANNIVHRDLAARNILLVSDYQVKISDFGLARITDNTTNCYTYKTYRKLPIKWYPPESIQYGKFSEQSDVWSYGVTLYEIFSYGKEPNLPGVNNEANQEVDEILRALNHGVRLPCPDECPKCIYSQLMLPCWQSNPDRRPNFSFIMGEFREIESLLAFN